MKEYISIAKIDGLHKKNNATKVQLDKCLQVVVKVSNIPPGTKYFKELDEENIFVFFVKFIRKK